MSSPAHHPLAPTPAARPVARVRLSRADRWLPVWIAVAMASGLLLGRLLSDLPRWLDAAKVGQTSLPIAFGLLVMMYPVLAKVRYDELGRIAAHRRMITTSLVLNWVVGPALMFALAWLLLPSQSEYRTGVILVGLARCIAMVLVWNELAGGDRQSAAVLVALNTLFQVLAYAGLGVFYLRVLPGWLGLSQTSLNASFTAIAATVLIFLGVPLAAGYLSHALGERRKGRAWYEQRFLPRIAPLARYGLLFTALILFALQGHTITTRPGDVARIALPLLAYFALMWTGALLLGLRLHLPTRAPSHWHSPRPATISSWRSHRSRSGCSAPPAARPWPGWSARRSWRRSSTRWLRPGANRCSRRRSAPGSRCAASS